MIIIKDNKEILKLKKGDKIKDERPLNINNSEYQKASDNIYNQTLMRISKIKTDLKSKTFEENPYIFNKFIQNIQMEQSVGNRHGLYYDTSKDYLK
tara:strand:- start:375 stop:662 length:288 start_codon:yes stop_codon:yes gene_type:complete